MAISRINHVAIKGISCTVPRHQYDVDQFIDVFSAKDIKKVTNMLGTKQMFRADESQTTADLCIKSAEKLLVDLSWDKESVEGVLFVTQTPDYLLPSTSSTIQHKLGLSEDCLSIDISLGCSGYVYGLMTAAQFIATRSCKRMLLLVGDTISKVISEQDRSVALLFGDAGSATAIEFDETATGMTFVSGSNGAGENNLVIPRSGFRNIKNEASSLRKVDRDGNIRSDEELYMNGTEIFNFTLERVPSLVTNVVNVHGWTLDNLDYCVLHQANKYMIEFLTRKIGLGRNKVPINIEKFGNTSSASIPLVLVDCLREQLAIGNNKICLAGFGVGYSWAAVTLELSNVLCSDLQYI